MSILIILTLHSFEQAPLKSLKDIICASPAGKAFLAGICFIVLQPQVFGQPLVGFGQEYLDTLYHGISVCGDLHGFRSDMQGKVVYQESKLNGLATLNFREASSGTYQLQLKTSDGKLSESHRIIIAK